jgi:hypothetical protein
MAGFWNAGLVSALILLAATGCQHQAIPYSVDSKPFTTAQAPLEQRADQIRKAGTRLGWLMTDVAPGEMRGRYNQKAHVASISIKYTAMTFSISYLPDTTKYADGTVHQRLNSHLQRLEKEIEQTAVGMRNADPRPEG